MTFGRKPFVRPPKPPLVLRSEPVRATMAPVVRPLTQTQKAGRHESAAWRRAVASLDCVRCGRAGETQCAHRNQGKGMGLKTDDALTAALCTTCHREIDQGSTMTRDERRAAIDEAILQTIRELAVRGLLKATAP